MARQPRPSRFEPPQTELLPPCPTIPSDLARAAGFTSFITLGDALWNQLGRRIENPGPNSLPSALGSQSRFFQAVNDNGLLAFKFNQIWLPAMISIPRQPMPHVTRQSPVSPTLPSPEQKLPYSLYADAINWTQFPIYNSWSVYPADKALYWFDFNFNTNITLTSCLISPLPLPTTTRGRRPLLPTRSYCRNLRALAVSRNPVSNATPIHSFYGVLAIPLNNPVSREGFPSPPLGRYIAGEPTPVPAASLLDVYPTAPPKIPIRASINTDSFGTLWRAFWNVMCDDLNPGPGTAYGGATGLPLTTRP